MKKGIVLKLFLLTTLLCMFILATIFLGITIFFKQYYANQKINDIRTKMESFEQEYLNAGEDIHTIQQLEQNFYQENATWITTLDYVGNMEDINNFSVSVQLDASLRKNFANRIITFPLYSLIDMEELERLKFYLEKGKRVYIDGINMDETIIPVIMKAENMNSVFENTKIAERLYGISATDEATEQLNGKNEIAQPTAREETQVYVQGEIVESHFPEAGSTIYTNRVFIERIKQFQADLLLKGSTTKSMESIDYEGNNVKYKILIRDIENINGQPTYIFAMTSLQPVDEAVQMLEQYYVYLIIFVLLLSLLASFYYSKKIAKPLLKINYTTRKMANLDFSKTIHITSKDEIGDLSQNINSLSNTLHSYINQLQQDIEKEKQLEKTRKEFIAGVSHELKTPLSILKSCISILEDDIASEKKDYYFKAMAKEVDKMDMLIVDMLELAKYESGTYKMKMDYFSIDETIMYICEQLAIDISNKHLQVYQQLSSIIVFANQQRIEQVITNFLTNAIRYTPEHEKIIISTIEESEQVKVCVENKGAHIATEHFKKIWDRFYRGDVSRQRSIGGTGLGLAISKNILELHGVRYGVENTEDGVLFFFYLNKKDR